VNGERQLSCLRAEGKQGNAASATPTLREELQVEESVNMPRQTRTRPLATTKKTAATIFWALLLPQQC
jgi:hypothetical protein